MPTRPVVAVHEPPAPLAPDLAAHWMLDGTVAYLNHGCFGARPRVVFEAQQRRRESFERQPLEWLDRRRAHLIEEAKAAVGGFVGARSEDFGFVTNATGGITTVLRSLRFEPGDELLTTNHVYNAIRNGMRHIAERWQARYVEINLALPLQRPGDIVAAIAAGITPRTRLVVIDHVSSPTAVRFPVREIIDLCSARGIDVAVDGAHAPGMIDLDVASLGAAYYAANLHKWVCAPVGAAFLWVRPDRQQKIHPTTISHFLGEGLAAEFAWQGTRDITPWLCAADALAYLGEFGWDRVRRHNHELATWVQVMLCERWGVQPATPLDGSMIGSMASVRLPDETTRFVTPAALQSQLLDAFRIEVPIIDWSGRWYVRPSCQIYNRPDQYELLADAVLDLARIGT